MGYVYKPVPREDEMMNDDDFANVSPSQLIGLLRVFLTSLGGFLVGRGMVTADTWAAAAPMIVPGVTLVVGVGAWCFHAWRQKALVREVADMPPVKAVVAPNTKLARDPDRTEDCRQCPSDSPYLIWANPQMRSTT
jgi:hypothetical protein